MSDYNLISLNESKVFLQISQDEKEHDELLTTLAQAVTSLIESYCDRQLKARDYTEYYDGDGDDTLYTNQWPINSITSFYDDVDRNFTDVSLIDADDYVYYENEGRISLLTRKFLGTGELVLSNGYQNLKLVYNAGYTTIPADLKLISGEIIVKKFKNFRDRRIGILNVSSSGEGFTINLDDLLPEHKMLLDMKYRKRGTQ